MSINKVSVHPEVFKENEGDSVAIPTLSSESKVRSLASEEIEKESFPFNDEIPLDLSERKFIDLGVNEEAPIGQNLDRLDVQKKYGAFTDSIPRLINEKPCHYSLDKRKVMIDDLVNKKEKALAPGPSSLLTLFVDEFIYMVNRLSTEAAKIGKVRGTVWSQSPPFMQLNETFFLLLHSLFCIQFRGCLWGCPIGAVSASKSPIPSEKIFEEITCLKGDLEQIETITKQKLPTAKKLKELIYLLEDLVTSQLDALYEPISTLIDSKGHFQRLLIRSGEVANLKTMIATNLELYKSDRDPKQFKSDAEELIGNIKREFRYIELFHKNFAKKCGENPSLTNQQAKELLLFLLEHKSKESFISFDHYIKKLHHLAAKIEDEPRSCLYSVAARLCESAINLEESITQEGIFSAIDTLLPSNHSSIKGITQNYFSEIVDAYGQVLSLGSSDMTMQNQSLEELTLNDAEKNYLSNLRKIWTEGFNDSLLHCEAELDLLRFHQRALRDDDLKRVDLVLALRDAFTITVFSNADYCDYCLKCVIEVKKHFADLNSAHKASIDFFCDSLMEIIQIHKSLMEGGTKSFKFLINEVIKLNKATEPLPPTKKEKKKKTKQKKKIETTLNDSPELNSQKSSAIPTPLASNKSQLSSDEPSKIGEVVAKNPSARKKRKKKAKSEVPPSLSPKDALLTLKNLLEGLKEKAVKGELDAEFRHTLLLDNLHNLGFKMDQFEETLDDVKKDSLSLHHVFSQFGLIHKIMEGVIQVSLAYLPIVDEKSLSILRQISQLGHDLVAYSQEVQYSNECPKNLSNVIENYQEIISFFSKANACVNYPHTTLFKKDLPSKTRELVDYLISVESEVKNPSHPDVQKKMLEQQATYVGTALSFLTQFFKALLDPSYTPPTRAMDGEFFNKEKIASEIEDEKSALSMTPSKVSIKKVTDEKKSLLPLNPFTRPIDTHAEALIALKWAKGWLAVNLIKPVKGKDDAIQRKKQRDSKLANVQLYLSRLAETLDPQNETHLFDVIFNGMELVRSALKETIVAALLDGDYRVDDGRHIVEAENLLYKNNPCYLMSFLKEYSPNQEILPNLNENQFKWLAVVHHILSYPHSHLSKREDDWSKKISKIPEEVKNIIAKRQKTEDDFILIGSKKQQEDSSTVNLEIKNYVRKNQKKYIFSALKALQLIINNF